MIEDVIVTGIPRSGTTLTAALIDGLNDAVCFSEPDWQDAWPREMDDRNAYAARLHADFVRVRALLLAGGALADRRAHDGSAVADYFRDAAGAPAGYRMHDMSRAGLSPRFLLGMKHNAHYSCALAEIVAHGAFSIVAVVRHPIATIRSWRALDRLPISQGRLPAAERLWPEVAAVSRDEADVLTRQARIYELFCARYLQLRERITLLRYEDLARDPTLLTRLTGRGVVRLPALRAATESVSDDAQSALIRRYVGEYCPTARCLYPELDDSSS